MKIPAGRRMNRNEYINLKTRAHSYGGGGSNTVNINAASVTMTNFKTSSI